MGSNSILCGGTRTSVKTERPWQTPLIFKEKENCVFCSKEQEDQYFSEEGWKTFKNSSTPFSYHRLIVPTECWPEEKLRSLGGADGIKKAIRISLKEARRTCQNYPLWLFAHIGYGAGQNIPHLHWHLCAPPADPQKLMPQTVMDEGVLLWRSENFKTLLCGVRAGQTIILPTIGKNLGEILEEYAAEAYRVVEIFNKKFHNPDYCLFFNVLNSHEFHARYTPILNNWGGSEFAALDYGTPFVLPWPHEATRDFLLE